MNTKVTYLYRDASNYKNSKTYVFEGKITDAGKESLINSLNDGLYFIPEQVGLERPWIDKDITEDDHCWCELDKDDIEITDESPDAPFTVEDLVAKFIAVGSDN